MGSREIRFCDKCGRESTAKNQVFSYDAKFSDGTRVTGDLCAACRKKMSEEFGLIHTTRRRRTSYTVTPLEEIPE